MARLATEKPDFPPGLPRITAGVATGATVSKRREGQKSGTSGPANDGRSPQFTDSRLFAHAISLSLQELYSETKHEMLRSISCGDWDVTTRLVNEAANDRVFYSYQRAYDSVVDVAKRADYSLTPAFYRSTREVVTGFLDSHWEEFCATLVGKNPTASQETVDRVRAIIRRAMSAGARFVCDKCEIDSITATRVLARSEAEVSSDPQLSPTPLGRNLSRLRTECGWSLDALAEKTGIDKKRIIDHIKHGTSATPRLLKYYATAFSKELNRTITPNELEKD